MSRFIVNYISKEHLKLVWQISEGSNKQKYFINGSSKAQVCWQKRHLLQVYSRVQGESSVRLLENPALLIKLLIRTTVLLEGGIQHR